MSVKPLKPLKTVTVALHSVILQKGDDYGPTPLAPTAQQAQDYLNQVYGPQTNTYFTVTRKDYALQYDVGGPGAAVNGKLDFRLNPPFTNEQTVLEDKAKEYCADYNVYFVRNYYGDDPDSIGHAVTRLDAAYIQNYSGKTSVATVLAHEFGHLVVLT